MYGLVDCDNFFVSCERIFQPHLKGRPIVVLSNNDGCVVSRSYEAKAIGIPMGIPYFKVEKILRAHNGEALSSNYELYADISHRVMSFINHHFPENEVYSIDECFIKIDDRDDLGRSALFIRNAVLQQIGISVSVGIAPTKTLCKAAETFAKRKNADKIMILTDRREIDVMLSQIDIIDLWGIGRHLAPKLNYMGIFTALELKKAPLKMLRKAFSINLEKTAMELRSQACIDLENPDHSKTLITSRSFETDINDFEQLSRIVAEFTDHACLRLRNQNAVAHGIMVFIRTNRFKDKPQYQNDTSIMLDYASAYTADFIKAALAGLRQIYDSSFYYKKAGVMLLGIESRTEQQPGLFETAERDDKKAALMEAFDNINHKLGRKSIYFGAQASGITHYIRRRLKSRSFTTSWDNLPAVV